jgi:hypothetical protein
MSVQQPDVGEWYRLRDGDSFEVVAIDNDDGTVEVQHFDGTVEEFDLDDWSTQRANGLIEDAEAPEDWSGSVDVEDTDEDQPAPNSGIDGSPSALMSDFDGLEGLDLFE